MALFACGSMLGVYLCFDIGCSVGVQPSRRLVGGEVRMLWFLVEVL